MTIRHIAVALYQAMSRRDKLAREYERAPLHQREAMAAELKAAEREVAELRRQLDAKKERA